MEYTITLCYPPPTNVASQTEF